MTTVRIAHAESRLDLTARPRRRGPRRRGGANPRQVSRITSARKSALSTGVRASVLRVFMTSR